MGKCITEVYSRVTGFFRPVQEWNSGKASEFKDRKKFKLDDGSGFKHGRAKDGA